MIRYEREREESITLGAGGGGFRTARNQRVEDRFKKATSIAKVL